MKTCSNSFREQGSVLVMAVLTMAILTAICATSLYIASQNANSGAQAASWQQALSGAESGVDQAIAALNTKTWTNWVTVSGSVPNLQPSPGPTPTAATGSPQTNQYNYISGSVAPQSAQYNVAGSITSTSEGNPLVATWTTVDTAGLPPDANGNQWYRVRATGTAAAVGPSRVSNQRLDNDLRKIGLRFDRKTSNAVVSPQASRTIEVIVQALPQSIWVRGITLKSTITMSGGGTVDSFDSSNPFKSNNGLYDANKRQSHGDVATANSGTTSNLGNTYVYGNLAYSGSAVKNSTKVQGTISTPFYATIPWPSDPTWPAGTPYTDYGSTLPAIPLVAGTKEQPALYKFTDLTISGGNSLQITGPNSGTDNNYVVIWVTGKLTTSGGGNIQQGNVTQPNVHVTYYVDGDVAVSGNSFYNQSGLAKNMTLIGVVPIDPVTQLPVGGQYNKFNVSGTGAFIGTVDAPGYDFYITGTADYSGAFIGNTMKISGGASVHYDEALNTNDASSTVGNYAFASWFEDTR
jgi:hypothetical protein